ncbi:MAG: hypothetical protein J1E61_04815 [Lachnospiraceae bacterium]|nr:hypothetical protein [Lachnospiraceae bacterium]
MKHQKTLMQLFTLLLSGALLLTGCGPETNIGDTHLTNTESNRISLTTEACRKLTAASVEYITVDESIGDLETESDPDSLDPEEIAEQIQNDDTLSQAFKDFLLGKQSATIGKDADLEQFSFGSPLSPGQSASMEDICNMIESGSKGAEHTLTGITYGLLDCGNDGQKELAIQYYYVWSHILTTMTLVLYEENGSLTINFAGWESYRSWSGLYTDGCYRSGGSGAAWYQYESYGILDSTGRLRTIYKLQTFWADHRPNIDPDKQAELDYFGYSSIDQITQADDEAIDDLLEDLRLEIYTIGSETYLNCHPESDSNASDKLSLPYYLSLCEENGVKFYTDAEIDALIEKNQASLGFADRKDGHEHQLLEWKPLFGDGSYLN